MQTLQSDIPQNQTEKSYQYIYVQLRPTKTMVTKCINQLQHVAKKHSEVQFFLTNVQEDFNSCLLTFSINFGETEQISTKTSSDAEKAFFFLNHMFSSMFDFLPQYVTKPNLDDINTVKNFAYYHGLKTQ